MTLTTPTMARRTPLAPLDLNRIRNQELSPWLRGSIQTWAAVGLGNAEIARKTFLTPATVQSTLQRNSQRHEGTTLSRSGRPQILIRRDRRRLLRLVRKCPKLTYNQIISETSLDVCKKTVYRILREEGIKKWLPNKGHFLLRKRLRFVLLGVSRARIGRGRSGRHTSSATKHQLSGEKVDDNGSSELRNKNGKKSSFFRRLRVKISVL